MAQFMGINGILLKDISAADMADFFVEHIFFKMMDGGRVDMKAGIEDLVDTSIHRVVSFARNRTDVSDKHIEKKVKHVTRPELRADLLKHYTPRIISALVTGGTKEMRSEIFGCITDPNFTDMF